MTLLNLTAECASEPPTESPNLIGHLPTRGALTLLVLSSLALARPTPAVAAAFPPLNHPATKEQVLGKFIWADLFTSEPQKAADFYCNLLGWTSAPVEQRNKFYLVLSNGGRPIAGISMRPAAAQPRPGVWIGYISVAKPKATLALAHTAGGTEHAPAHNFPNRGSQAIFSDNEGSPVGIIQSSSGDPPDEEPKPGDWNWFELYSMKPQAAVDFYGKVFGYAVSIDTRATSPDHRLLSSGSRARAGVALLPEGADAHSGWLGCLRVDDIEKTVARVTSLGGAIVVAPRPAELGSRFAVISDPTGGSVGLVQYLDNANPGDHL